MQPAVLNFLHSTRLLFSHNPKPHLKCYLSATILITFFISAELLFVLQVPKYNWAGVAENSQVFAMSFLEIIS